MNVVAWILFPKTAAHFKNPQGPETNFYCTKIINEVITIMQSVKVKVKLRFLAPSAGIAGVAKR